LEKTDPLTTPGQFQMIIPMPYCSAFYSSHKIPAKGGSSSNLGKPSDTMIMDYLAAIATQRAFDQLDLIDA